MWTTGKKKLLPLEQEGKGGEMEREKEKERALWA